MNNLDVEQMKKNIDKSSRFIHISAVLATITVIVTLIAIVGLLGNLLNSQQSNLDRALQENELEHEKTQKYIRCISLLPISERTPSDFDRCGKSGDVITEPNEEVQE